MAALGDDPACADDPGRGDASCGNPGRGDSGRGDGGAPLRGSSPRVGTIPGAASGGPYRESDWPRPARLSVGVVSAGRVGTAIGEALERVGHVVSGCVAPSEQSRSRARTRLPETAIGSVEAVVKAAELLVLAVPDTELAPLVARLTGGGPGAAPADGEAARADTEIAPAEAAPGDGPAGSGAHEDWSGRIVLHTSGANGIGVLAPLAERGAICLAAHPAMTFTGDAADTDRLASACFGVTAADEVGMAIAQSLVLEIGGEPVAVPESSRTLYHAALAHGSNHLVTLVRDAATALAAALRPQGEPSATDVGQTGQTMPQPSATDVGQTGQHQSATDVGPQTPLSGTITDEAGAPERILAPLLTAALDNALRYGDRALTGPVARGDTEAVAAHLDALTEAAPAVAETYRALALRTAQRSGAPDALIARIQEQTR